MKEYYDKTGSREDIVQRTELYNRFKEDTGTQCTQKSFSEDMVKSDVNTKKNHDGKYYYYGIKRKDIIQEDD